MTNFRLDQAAIRRLGGDVTTKLTPSIQRVLDPIQDEYLGQPIEEVDVALRQAHWPAGFTGSVPQLSTGPGSVGLADGDTPRRLAQAATLRPHTSGSCGSHVRLRPEATDVSDLVGLLAV